MHREDEGRERQGGERGAVKRRWRERAEAGSKQFREEEDVVSGRGRDFVFEEEIFFRKVKITQGRLVSNIGCVCLSFKKRVPLLWSLK
jgi:hypothetical protein